MNRRRFFALMASTAVLPLVPAPALAHGPADAAWRREEAARVFALLRETRRSMDRAIAKLKADGEPTDLVERIEAMADEARGSMDATESLAARWLEGGSS